MNLDDLGLFQQLDPGSRLAAVGSLPDQLEAGWRAGLSNPLPAFGPLERVVLAGMGASAAVADLLAGYALGSAPVPLVVVREDVLPAWAAGERTLVVCLSHSGETYETLAVLEQAIRRGCQVLVVTGGGTLAERAGRNPAGRNPAALWRCDSQCCPAGEIGYPFGLLLAAFTRLGLLADPSAGLKEALEVLRTQQATLVPESPVARNPAKRMAGQMVGRWVVVFGSGMFEPVARRWKARLNVMAKSLAQVEVLPEADHNSLSGLNRPEGLLSQVMALFLDAPSLRPNAQLYLDYTRQIYMMQAINTDVIQASGKGPLAHLWSLLQFGDFTAYYLAMAYGEDPAPAAVLAALKEEMSKQSPNA